MILQKMKEEKERNEENKKIIQGKIRAIQIESKESLKKFKKKPVDSTIQFRVDVDYPITVNKTKKAKPTQTE